MSEAIEWNRMALKRIVAELVDLAGLAHPPTSPLRGGRREASGGGRDLQNTPTRRPDIRRPPLKGEVEAASRAAPHPELRAEGEPRRTIPRLLWRTILQVLRPAEAAARRLIIAASRGIVVPVPRLRQPKPKPPTVAPPRNSLVWNAHMAGYMRARAESRDRARAGLVHRSSKSAGGSPAGTGGCIPAFSLFDPRRRLMLGGPRRRTVPPHAAPRICVPGYSEPRPLPPPPSPNDPIDVARLVQRLTSLTAALDDLPGQALRFAKWRARRDAITAREKEAAASGTQAANHSPRRFRRTWPLRLGRPYGGRLLRYDPDGPRRRNIREVDEILAHCHALAVYALEYPDTS